MEVKLRICNTCKLEFELNNYHKDSSKIDGRVYSCKRCFLNKRNLNYHLNKDKINKRRKELYPKNSEKIKIKQKEYNLRNSEKRRNTRLLSEFGISLDEYEKILIKQNYVCDLCKNPEKIKLNGKIKRLSVDHCYISNKIRGLLCNNCNSNLVGSNTIDTVKKVEEYLKKHLTAELEIDKIKEGT